MKKTATKSFLIAMLFCYGGVSSRLNAQTIAAGHNHSLFVCADGTSLAVGSNENGALGDGTTDDTFISVQVSILAGTTGLAGGGQHSLFIKNDSTVWAVGQNDFGQLGDGTLDNRSTPLQIAGLTGITTVSGRSLALFFPKK